MNYRFQSLVEIAPADDPSIRYGDAAEFLGAIKRRSSSIADAARETKFAERQHGESLTEMLPNGFSK